jgi:hypothetical protein
MHVAHHDPFAGLDAGRISSRHLREQRRAEERQQRAYEGLEAARRAAGVARIVMGLHLVTLLDTDGWQGRTGAKSFRRFLQEEGIEPKAAFQYMAVARAFLLGHAVPPERIALVSMRVLVVAAQYLKSDEESEDGQGNVEDIIALVTSMPSAEAHEALRERFELNQAATEAQAKARVSTPVARILDSVDHLTHDGRAELFMALRVGAAAKPVVSRRPAIIPPEPPFPEHPEQR